MNKVITINLGGHAYQLEEGGYDALRSYLDTAQHLTEKLQHAATSLKQWWEQL